MAGYNNCEGIFSLPNEILIKILAPFFTHELLPWTVVSYRFHDLILRILHGRLLAAAALDNQRLMLECFHPAFKNREPYLFCDYLGTPGLSSETEGQGLVYNDFDNFGRLGKLGGLFSRFSPVRPESRERVPRAHPAGGEFPDSSTQNASLSDQQHEGDADSQNLVSRSVNLDPGESFSQLCVITHLVRPGPRSGVFGSLVTISDGLVRIWRDWLGQRAAANDKALSSNRKEEEDSHLRTLWLDNRRNVGLQVKVQEKRWKRTAPILLHRDEEPAVRYEMYCEELLIRTTHLLLAVEKALLQESNDESNRAMVFGSFITSS